LIENNERARSRIGAGLSVLFLIWQFSPLRVKVDIRFSGMGKIHPEHIRMDAHAANAICEICEICGF
jgi:hypothetical protein